MMPQGFGYRQEPSDIHWFLAIGTVMLSVAIHVAALYFCSGLKVDRHIYHGRDYSEVTRVPPMRVGVLTSDPVAQGGQAAADERKVVAPPSPSISDQVKALNQTAESALTAPQPVPVEMPTAHAVAVPEDLRKIANTPWLPRQEIAQIFDRKVQDEIAALPRLEIPEVVRVPKAPDVVPSVDPSGHDPSKALDPLKPMPASAAIGDSKELSGVSEAFSLPASSELNPDSALSRFGNGLVEQMENAAAAEKPLPEHAPIPEPDRPSAENLTPAEKSALAAQDKIEKLRETVTYQPLDDKIASSVDYFHDSDAHRYYFRIAIAPRADRPAPVIPKDIAWVQDVSGSISEERLRACRKVLAQEVTALNPGDRFTVVSFRNKLDRCFPDWADPTAPNIAKAQAFIEKMHAHGMTDVFGSLRALLTLPRDPARPLIVLIATDGKPTTGVTESATIISQFSALNNGMISVYIFGTVSSANERLINMLTYCNRGTSEIASFFSWDIGAAMGGLAASIRNPIMSDVTIAFDSASHIEAYPRRTTNLYREQPLVFCGSCPDTTAAFTCQIRGLAHSVGYDTILRFAFNGKPAGSSKLRTLWANQKMYHLAARYALNPPANRGLLTEMDKLSEEFDVPAIYSISGD